MKPARPKDHIRQAARAHTNLTIFAAVVKMMESGVLYGDQPEARQIIRIALRAQQRMLREYDREVAALLSERSASK